MSIPLRASLAVAVLAAATVAVACLRAPARADAQPVAPVSHRHASDGIRSERPMPDADTPVRCAADRQEPDPPSRTQAPAQPPTASPAPTPPTAPDPQVETECRRLTDTMSQFLSSRLELSPSQADGLGPALTEYLAILRQRPRDDATVKHAREEFLLRVQPLLSGEQSARLSELLP